ncbi:MAG TPA: hypothetical protein VID19_06165 [Candidatus Eremiobacteraceae bacterium]|jgi:hypothetical protein
MKSHSFPGPSYLAAMAFAACAAFLVTGSAPAPGVIVPSAPLATIVRAALVQAPGNFAAWRAGTRRSSADGIVYKPTAAMNHICTACDVIDEFATADSDERYALTFQWIVPTSWSRAQTIAYIQVHIGELMPNFTASQGTDDSGESWFDWSKGTPTEFVYVKTFSEKSGSGFEVRVGHYLQKSVHFTPYARLSATQRDALAKAVRNFVQLGVQNGSDNFVSLRGAATDKDNNFFDTSVAFGEFLKSCDVDGIFSAEHASGGTSKWILECTTPSLGGTKSDVEAIIQSAVAAALPDGFVVTTDPKYLGTSDFRWDRSSDTMDVEVWAFDNNDGTFDYHVQMYHFTS